jgi:amino acid adenylation domain-containing protein
MYDAAVPLISDFLTASAARLPDKVALVCGGERVTYRDLDERSNALAGFFVERGLTRGDRAVVFGDNTVESVVAFWAVLKAGAVPSVVNPLTKADKLAYVLNDGRARALVTEARLAPSFEPAAARAPHLAITVVAGDLPAARLTALPGGVTLRDVLATPRPRPPRRCIDVDLASVIYTSGSTGEPKGVMLTHKNMVTAATTLTTLFENTEDDVILAALPLAFNYGLYQMIMAFKVGARLVLEKGFAYPAKVLEVMAREGVTGFPGVPTMFAVLAEMKGLDQFDLSKVRYITNTAAALGDKHVRCLQAACPNAKIFSMYGLTECKRVSYLPPELILDKPDSIGVAVPNTEFWLVDEHDRVVGPGETGQIVVRGSNVMRGYWEKPEETARALRPGPMPGEVVFYTGDLGRLDEDGHLHFVGRMDDIIKTRGEKVAPREVERAIAELSGVKECAVVGVADPILGQAIKAFVVLEAGAAMTERQLVQLVSQRLEAFAVPKHITFVDDLPKTMTGKIKKTDLVE